MNGTRTIAVVAAVLVSLVHVARSAGVTNTYTFDSDQSTVVESFLTSDTYNVSGSFQLTVDANSAVFDQVDAILLEHQNPETRDLGGLFYMSELVGEAVNAARFEFILPQGHALRESYDIEIILTFQDERVSLTGYRNPLMIGEPGYTLDAVAEEPAIYDLAVTVLGEHGTVEPGGGSYPEGTVVTLTATPDKGYIVEQWSGTDDDASCALIRTVTMNSSKTVTVEFKQPHAIMVPVQFTTVQGAIDAATCGDVVLLSRGVHSGDINFGGKNIIVTSEHPDDPCCVATTIIQGTGAGSVVTFSGDESRDCILDGITIRGGNTTENGGGICVNGAMATIKNCVITGNHADGNGGGLDGCNGSITGCIISDNSAGHSGGGMHNKGVAPTMENCTFTANTASTGGAMYNDMYQFYDQTVTVIGCTFIGNRATGETYSWGYAGAMHNYCGNQTLINCLFIDNTAANDASDLHSIWATTIMINCTLSGSKSDSAPAMSLDEAFTLATNCIFWDIDGGIADYDDFATITYCNVSGGFPGEGNIDADPMFADPVENDYRLTSGSPCIDAGDPFYIPHPNETDLGGNARFKGLAVDMGAYEFQPPNTWYVDAATGSDSNDGRTPQTAFATIQKAVDSADDGDLVIVFPGTYAGPGNRDIDFKGKAITVRGSNPNSPNIVEATIIDCGGSASERHRGFFFHSGEDTTSVLSGLTITNGYAYGGGAIRCEGSSPKIVRCVLTGNHAEDGGGLDNYNSRPTVVDCTFTDNTAENGAGMYNEENSDAIVDKCTFTNNKATHYGGAIGNYSSSPRFSDCEFMSNSSDDDGGAAHNLLSSPVFSGCKFLSNEAHQDAGAMFCQGGDIALTDCGIVNCTAENGDGGGIVLDGANAVLVRSWMSYNEGETGGGILCTEGELTLTDCIFSGNRSTNGPGGGMACFEAVLTMSGGALDDNRSENNGAGIYADDQTEVTIENCSITDNEAESRGGGIYAASTNLTVIGCRISKNKAAFGGGGIGVTERSHLDFRDCVFRVNDATVGGGLEIHDFSGGTITNCTFGLNTATQGAAVANITFSDPEFANCTFHGNKAMTGGGMANIHDSSPALTNCIFRGNHADNGGGGMYNDGDNRPRLVNCVFSWNYSLAFGTAIHNVDEASPTLINCTLNRNYTFREGAAIYNRDEAEPRLWNCILWDNTPEEIMLYEDSELDAASCNIKGGWPGPANIDVDPLFVDANGPDSMPSTDDLRLSFGSPCIDTGDNRFVPSTVHTDPDGTSRIVNGVVDMGAYEFHLLIVDDNAPDDPGPDDPQVSDPNENGSEAHPFDSIQQALDAAGDGYTVRVRRGRYAEPDNADEFNFLDKNVVLTSSNPTDWDVVNDTVIDGYVQFGGSEDPNCHLTGFKIHNIYLGAIYGNRTQATISHCNVSGNGPCGAIAIRNCDGIISNCLITDNTTFLRCGVFPVVFECNGVIRNCTIANNDSGVSVGTATIENCIIYNNMGPQLAVTEGENLNISYCDLQGGLEGIVGEGSVNWGPGNIDTDPCFVRTGYWMMNEETLIEGNYHLMTEGWRWNTENESWTFDRLTSRCIDAGNPGWPLGEETGWIPRDPDNEWGVNRRINMGAFGGTAQASMAPHGWMYPADMDNNGRVNFLDLARMANAWQIQADRNPSDLNRDGTVNLLDFPAFAEDWHDITFWHSRRLKVHRKEDRIPADEE